MAKLTDLQLANDQVGEIATFEDAPDQFGGPSAPPPDPGRYRFQFPADLSTVFEVIPATEQRTQRLNFLFEDDNPLKIVQSPDGSLNGFPYETRLSNVERARGKEKIKVSDADYLFMALGEKTKPRTNIEYANVMTRQGNKTFAADLKWSWTCSKTRETYHYVTEEGKPEPVLKKSEGHLGCGTRYYQDRDVKPLADGKYPLRVTCGCGAILRAFDGLENFGA